MAQPSKNATTIITDFELQVNDITELSSDEELRILNRKYIKLCSDRQWEFLKKNVTGALSQDANGYFIAVPADFNFFSENNNYTDNTIGTENNAAPRVVFLVSGTTLVPYQVINYSDRRQYVNRTGYVYLDPSSNQIRFTGQAAPQFLNYDFDYIKVPPLLGVNDFPLFPGQFHDILVFGMATDNDVLQLSPRAQSYQVDNQQKYDDYFQDLCFWNSQFMNN